MVVKCPLCILCTVNVDSAKVLKSAVHSIDVTFAPVQCRLEWLSVGGRMNDMMCFKCSNVHVADYTHCSQKLMRLRTVFQDYDFTMKVTVIMI